MCRYWRPCADQPGGHGQLPPPVQGDHQPVTRHTHHEPVPTRGVEELPPPVQGDHQHVTRHTHHEPVPTRGGVGAPRATGEHTRVKVCKAEGDGKTKRIREENHRSMLK